MLSLGSIFLNIKHDIYLSLYFILRRRVQFHANDIGKILQAVKKYFIEVVGKVSCNSNMVLVLFCEILF